MSLPDDLSMSSHSSGMTIYRFHGQVTASCNACPRTVTLDFPAHDRPNGRARQIDRVVNAHQHGPAPGWDQPATTA